MNARSPWEYIGGVLLLASVLWVLNGEWQLALLCGVGGSACVWAGYRQYQRRQQPKP
ncbi:MAG: hypothetical protein ACE5E4_06990 [Candidatus Binatia bacterium]